MRERLSTPIVVIEEESLAQMLEVPYGLLILLIYRELLGPALTVCRPLFMSTRVSARLWVLVVRVITLMVQFPFMSFILRDTLGLARKIAWVPLLTMRLRTL